MKRKKLLHKLSDYLDMDKRKQCERKDKIKEVLKQLRRKEHKILEKLELEENDIKRKRLQKEVQIIHAQRIKGLKFLKNLRCD